MNIIRRLLAVTLVMAVSILGVNVAEVSDNYPRVSVDIGGKVITLGDAVYAAGSVDYTLDGTDDNVQFQSALNALPATGGRLVIVSATQINFSATVTRAIPNVTIEGSGRGTYFVHDGITALFTAGSDNWTFCNLRTDAGAINMGATTNWMWTNVAIGATYYAYRSPYGQSIVNDLTVSSLTDTGLTSGRVLVAGTGGLLGDTDNLTFDGTSLQVSTANVTRSATYTVAASNAPAHVKAQADYVCDGTDDQVEIQAADTLLTSGGKIQLTNGRYILATSYFPSDNITLSGFGRSTILTGCNSLISLMSVDGVCITDLNLDGNVSFTKGIYIEASTKPVISNVYAYGFTDTAFDIESLTAATDDGGFISNCNVYDNTGIGIALGDSGGLSEYNTITNCSVSHNNVGIKVVSNNNVIINTHCGNNALFGYWITGARCTIVGGTANHNTQNGITVTGTSGHLFSNITITQNGYNGINIGASVSTIGFDNIYVYANGSSNPGSYNDSEIVLNHAANANYKFTNCFIGYSTVGSMPNYAIYNRNTALTRCEFTNCSIYIGAIDSIYASTGMTFKNNTGYIAPSEIRTDSGSLIAGLANAIAFSWHNPEAQDIYIRKVVISVTIAGGTAGSGLQVGIADNSTGANLGTELGNTFNLNSVSIYDSWNVTDNGTQTKWIFCQDSASATDGYVVGKILTANASSLVGKFYIEYAGR